MADTGDQDTHKSHKRDSRFRPGQAPSLTFEVQVAEGELAEHLRRAQAETIKDVLEWITLNQQDPHRSRSEPSKRDHEETAAGEE